MTLVPPLDFSSLNLNGVSSSEPSSSEEDQIETLAQQMLGSSERITSNHLLLDEPTHCSWSIGTPAGHYVLRKPKLTLASNRFYWIVIANQRAAEMGVGSSVRAIDRIAQAILTGSVNAFPITPFERNRIPYRMGLAAIKRLHTAMNLASLFLIASPPPPQHASLMIARGQEPPVSLTTPRILFQIWQHLIERFAPLAPRLIEKMTIIHGNFCRTNALFHRDQPHSVFVVNFEHCAQGHPYCDLVQYVWQFTAHQQEEFLRSYLGLAALGDEERQDLRFAQATYLMQEAVHCFQRSDEVARLDEIALPSSEIEALALAPNSPGFELIEHPITPAEFQRRGALALAQILQSLEIIPQELREMPPEVRFA